MQIQTIFEMNVPVLPARPVYGPVAKKFNTVRGITRDYRRETELHLEHVRVMIGVLFRSGRSFKIATRILGHKTRSACPDGRVGRARSIIGDTTFPLWQWTIFNQHVNMGTCIRCSALYPYFSSHCALYAISATTAPCAQQLHQCLLHPRAQVNTQSGDYCK